MEGTNFLDDWPLQFERDNLSFTCCGDDENIKNKPDLTGIINRLDEFNIRPDEALYCRRF
jgi:hypothetical protein